MTTKEAFTFLVHSPYLWKATGHSKNARRIYKHRLVQDEWPSIAKMEELLSAAFEVKQEKIWKLK